MKKSIMSLVIVAVLLISFTGAGNAASGDSLDVYHISSNGTLEFYLNGEDFYGEYILKDGTTYMKLRDVGENLGVQLYWNQSKKEVSFYTNGSRVSMNIGSPVAYIGGQRISISSPFAVDGYTYLPLRNISEVLDIHVYYKDLRPQERAIREVIFRHNPSMRAEEKKGTYYYSNNEMRSTFFLSADSYDLDTNTMVMHAYSVVVDLKYGEGHTATWGWYDVDLDTGVIQDAISLKYLDNYLYPSI